jgi:hypothetical protein
LFWLDSLVEGGEITNRTSFDRVAKQTGKDPAELYRLPEIEQELLYLFDYYGNIKGQEPLTFREVDSWQRLTGYQLSPAEVELLFLIDTTFYTVKNKSE